jgi:hypothetical protein
MADKNGYQTGKLKISQMDMCCGQCLVVALLFLVVVFALALAVF